MQMEEAMAGSPQLKIYHPTHGYIGCVKFGEDAAALAAINGAGTTIRYGHSKRDIVWTEGSETFPAGESYDMVAKVISDRIEARFTEAQATREAGIAELERQHTAIMQGVIERLKSKLGERS